LSTFIKTDTRLIHNHSTPEIQQLNFVETQPQKLNMKVIVLLALFGVALARPQDGPAATCERREVAPGKFEYVCNANPGTLTQESILWVPTSGSSQELLIRVPNYRLQEIIRAGLISRGAGSTNVRVHVERPEIQSVVEGRFEDQPGLAPNVQVTYDGIQPVREVHYGGSGVQYAPLSKPISEPGAGRFKKSA
jgi:hypothetical protein